MNAKELKDKIAKMKLGLDSPFIQDAQKETLKTAISNAEKQLAEMEKTEKNNSDKFETGTPAKFIREVNGQVQEVSGEIVMRQGEKAMSLYKDENYAGDGERIIYPDWDQVFKFSESEKAKKFADDLKDKIQAKKAEKPKPPISTEKFLIKNSDGNFYSRTVSTGKPKWNDNFEFGHVFDEKEIEFTINMLKREFPEMEIEKVTLKDAAKVEPKKPKTAATTKVDQTLNFINLTVSYGPNLNSVVDEMKDKLKDKGIYLWETLSESNFLIALRVEKIAKLFCEVYSLDLPIVKKFLALDIDEFYSKEDAEKLKLNIINLVVSNFVSKSQFLAMKSSELDSVKRDVYNVVMKMPVIGQGTEKYWLHYFTAGSDFYISEIDYGSNLQDFGFAVLNGDLQNAERGYISIDEMISSTSPAELDLYFDPISHKDLIEQLEEKEEEETPKDNYWWYEVKYNDFVELVKNIPEDQVLSEYRTFEDKNYHIENIVLMAVKVGNKQQIEKAKEIYIEFLKANAVDKDLSEKREKLYYELHDAFRKKYIEVDNPTISEKEIDKLVNRCIAQVFLEYGNNTEIKSIDEVVSDNQIDVHFELVREIDGMRDRSEKTEVHISFDGKILDEFTFPIPESFDENKFLATVLDDLDMRSRNEIYSYNTFLKDHAEELVGEKVATKTVKKLSPEKQEKLKSEYAKKAKEKNVSRSVEKPVAVSGKVKLTKRLKAHGVTQEMVNEVNRTKEGVLIRSGKQTGGKSTAADKRIKFALKPGKRLSANGTIYYEYRKNRSDKNPEKGL